MEKQRRTFLSYSRANKEFALRLAKELKSEGFPVWLDQLDIPLGARWDVEVEKALIECEIFMIIITKDSISSENVLDEIGYAIDSGKRFLPVLLEKCNIPLRLRRFQYVDFTSKSFDEGVETAKDLLRTLNTQSTIPRKDLADGEQADPAMQPRGTQSVIPTTTTRLRREKMEQEIRFREEQAKLLQEKAELEKKLEEERSTHERVAAIRHQNVKPRSNRIGLLGFSALVVFAVGFAITRMMAKQASIEAPINTSTPSAENPVTEVVIAAIPVTADESATPTTEVTAPTRPPTEIATETISALLPEISDGKGVEMVLVPQGDFLMGSDQGEPDEQPPHNLFLDAFYIDKFEVTNGLYKACVDDVRCEPPRQTYFFAESPNRIYYGNSQYDNYPVVYVDWNMAKAYCEWRDARLPTEAEWEKAARGITGNTYPWGQGLDCQKANYQGCVNQTSEVGVFKNGVSPYGAYDMTGNVWEWVADWYADNYYSISPGNNPSGPISGQSRVLRGGSWPRFDVTTYHRSNFAPTYNTFDIGFRCARAADF